MNLVKLSGHTVDVDALPEAPVVLDAGSRDFGFSNELLLYRPKAIIYAMDPDPTILTFASRTATSLSLALVGDARKTCKYAAIKSAEGRFLYEGEPAAYHHSYGYQTSDPVYEVPCISISRLTLGRF